MWRLDPGQIEVVDDQVAAALKRKTPAERLAMVFEANRTMRALIAGHLHSTHPEWDEDQVQAEVARRMLHGSD